MVIDLLKRPTHTFSRSISRLHLISDICNEIDKERSERTYDYKIYLLTGFYIVNLVSIWQVFIENLIEYGCRLIQRSSNSRAEELLCRISIDTSKEAIKRFNTPDRERINQIFFQCFSIKEITKCWKIENNDFMSAYDSLISSLRERHKFSHTGRYDGNISIDHALKFSTDLFDLSLLLERRLIEELKDYDIT